jgi:hypothetical protein
MSLTLPLPPTSWSHPLVRHLAPLLAGPVMAVHWPACLRGIPPALAHACVMEVSVPGTHW